MEGCFHPEVVVGTFAVAEYNLDSMKDLEVGHRVLVGIGLDPAAQLNLLLASMHTDLWQQV